VKLLGLVVTCALLVACGSDKPALTAQASLLLGQQISNARVAASHGDVAGAVTQLDGVSGTLDQLRGRGLVTKGRAAAIAAAINDAKVALQSTQSSTTTPSTGATTAPTAAPSTESSTTTSSTTTTEPPTSTTSSTTPGTTDTTKKPKGGGDGGGGGG
jgi:hypothetical protein